MQMDERQRWMYGDRRSFDFIVGLHKFIHVADVNKEDVLCLVHMWTVGMLRSSLPREPFKATCFGEVSCPAIIVGPDRKSVV